MAKCLICSSENVKINPAKLAPFLAYRMYSSRLESTSLIYCKECGFSFFELRPGAEEFRKLYKGYRDEAYQKERQKYEPWYSREINSLLADYYEEAESRRNNLLNFLNKHIQTDTIKNILDFGGDKGQYIPNICSCRDKYVYDISGVEAKNGVISLNKLEDVFGLSFDLIMCCHALEHISYPSEAIKMIKKIGNKNSYFYFELPFDSPFYCGIKEKLQFVFNRYFKFKDLIVKGVEILKDRSFQMHEHINYFTPKSLRILLKKQGFDILAEEIVWVDSKWRKQKVMCILAKLGKQA